MSLEKGRSRALREAAGANNIAGIDAALAGSTEFKALLNSGDYIGKTALHWAAGRGRIEAVRHLLLLGAKVGGNRIFQKIKYRRYTVLFSRHFLYLMCPVVLVYR
jgi:ankyrin repeat protein